MATLRTLATSLLTIALFNSAFAAAESINAGDIKASDSLPFDIKPLANFDTPWALAFLPDGKALVTEKPGHMFLVDQQGNKQAISGVPEVATGGQNGLLDVALAPDFNKSKQVYFSYNAPANGGSKVTLMKATLATQSDSLALTNKKVVWQQSEAASGGQPGGRIAFSPDERYLFFTVGDRMAPDSAQNPAHPSGKIFRLTLEGGTPDTNPHADDGGVRAQTWSTGHRTPYGLAFSSNGTLWETEMGPKGGDELNLIKPEGNYGWGDVSNGDNYDGSPIPDHSTRPEYDAPAVYWTPVISPGGIALYNRSEFPGWKESLLISSLSGQGLVRVGINNDNQIGEIERWKLNKRIRDVAVAPDGAIWLLEDSNPGQLMRLTLKAQ
ncbi:PQQ-dependent sugar dehydrogenase [Carnimonas nigrificans]|uniref:PQQ-dependent sugar dehydrogenase n=1 Tax=Carnimonas nigrificans TaxID=64323 RepID=UPI0004724D63|nr:PQQ-dependent sugar dehydrogenase [Carnimonas nigrificans]